jgi:hypothetical protein
MLPDAQMPFRRFIARKLGILRASLPCLARDFHIFLNEVGGLAAGFHVRDHEKMICSLASGAGDLGVSTTGRESRVHGGRK